MATLTLETVDILDPDIDVQRGYPQAEWTLLKHEAPAAASNTCRFATRCGHGLMRLMEH
jgi:hypothetical protein